MICVVVEKSRGTTIAICLSLLCIANASSQENVPVTNKGDMPSNSFRILLTDFYSRGTSHERFPIEDRGCSQQGLYYERRVIGNLYLGVGYAQWYNLFRGGKSVPVILSTLSHTEYQSYEPIVGRLESRFEYKMLDFYVLRRFNLGNNRHVLGVGIGATYCWGQDQYLAWHYYYGFESHGGYEYKKAHYYGVTPAVSYDYLFWQKRLSVGGDIRARYYSGRQETIYDYGVHIGVNF